MVCPKGHSNTILLRIIRHSLTSQTHAVSNIMESLTLAGKAFPNNLVKENIPQNMKNIYIIMQTILMPTATIGENCVTPFFPKTWYPEVAWAQMSP